MDILSGNDFRVASLSLGVLQSSKSIWQLHIPKSTIKAICYGLTDGP